MTPRGLCQNTTRTRTSTNPNDTGANAAGKSARVCGASKPLSTPAPSVVETVHELTLEQYLSLF